jgi:hypothetical protein
VNGELHTPDALPPGERAPGLVNTRTSPDDVEKRKFLTLPELELRPLGRRYTDYAIPACQLKNPVTLLGMEPATFQFVA